jgi:hypothetical protein
MLDEGTTKNIKFLELMVQRHNMPNSPADGTRALEQKIIANLMKQSNQTNKELEEAQIIHTPFQWWQSPELYLIDTTIGAMVIEKSHTHGKNGCSRDAFRNLLLKNELKGQNPFTIINNRAMNG